MRAGPLTVYGGFFLLVGFLLFFDENGLFFCQAMAALIHEAGHFIALHALGGRISRLTLSAFGFYVQIAPFPPLSYGREIAALLAGPAVSLSAAFLTPLLLPPTSLVYALAGTLFIQGVFNLLPAQNLDGGRALHALASRVRDEETADRLLRAVTGLTVAATLFISVAAFFLTGCNHSFLLLGGYAVFSMLIRLSQKGALHERKNL